MARRSVLGIFIIGFYAAGCVNVTAPPTAPITSTPSVVASVPRLTPTVPPATTPTSAPTATEPTTQETGTPTPGPTDEPTPTATEPQPTLGPGETPKPTPLDIGNLLTSTLSVTNMTDDQVTASVDLYTEGDKVGTVAKLDIEPDGALIQGVPAATYVVSITVGSAAPVTCDLTVAEGSEVDFAVVGTRIIVTRPDVAPTAPEDIFIESSPLCA